MTATVKIDLMQEVKDARGRPYAPDAQGEEIRVRDLIHMALQDEPAPQPGAPPPQVDSDEKRRRWRLMVQSMDGREQLDVTRDDADYVVQRAAVMLLTPAFGFLDSVIAAAIGESALQEPSSNGDGSEVPPEPAE